MLQITYIHHDCFLASTSDFTVVFDYAADPESENQSYPDFLNAIDSSKPLYVIVSHFHKDHFNKAIFDWEKKIPNIHYIVSRDVEKHVRYLFRDDTSYRGFRPSKAKVIVLRKGERYTDSLLDVLACGSTDIGNSYAVTFLDCKKKLFHAGDLNCWAWRDESTEAEIKAAEDEFNKEVDGIAAMYPEFDVVMFPVDSRIGTGYYSGAAEFVKKIYVKHFFPMHFTLADTPEQLEQRIADAANFPLYAAPSGEYIILTKRGDCWAEGAEGVTPITVETIADDVPAVLSQSFFLSAGETNAEQELSLSILTAKLIDIATTHANALGLGNPAMPNTHSGWVLSRLTIEMFEYPKVNTHYGVSTWVESWNRHFSERAFAITDASGREVGFARSIWMVLDTETHTNVSLDVLNMPEDKIAPRECPIKKQKKHINLLTPREAEDASGKFLIAEPDFFVHRFGYSDLDAYRHVNTVRYVSLLMNLYPLSEHDAKRVERMELSFLHEGGYNRPLDVLRAPLEVEAVESWEAIELRDSKDKEPVFFARLKMVER